MSFIQPAQTRRGSFGRTEFLNAVPTIPGLKGSIAGLLWRFLSENRGMREPKTPPGPFVTLPEIFGRAAPSVRVTWMGHSTVLLEMDGKRILLDPMWGNRASFLPFAGPKRFFPPPLTITELPKLDAIVLSHDHYDHLDAPTWRALAGVLAGSDVKVITSLGVAKTLDKYRCPRRLLTELDWSETAAIADGVTITCLPARHFSGRALWNRNGTLWSAFSIKTPDYNVFFGADSGPFEEGFEEIGRKFGPFDLTMLEIGAYDRQWPDIHMGPAHALLAHQLLRGRVLLPIHWGTFNLAIHPWKEPVEEILSLASERRAQLLLPVPGTPTLVGPYISYWWQANDPPAGKAGKSL